MVADVIDEIRIRLQVLIAFWLQFWKCMMSAFATYEMQIVALKSFLPNNFTELVVIVLRSSWYAMSSAAPGFNGRRALTAASKTWPHKASYTRCNTPMALMIEASRAETAPQRFFKARPGIFEVVFIAVASSEMELHALLILV